MNNYLNSVKEFHESFSHPISKLEDIKNKDNGSLSDREEVKKLRETRLNLLFEELSEYSDSNDTVKRFRKLCKEYVIKKDKELYNKNSFSLNLGFIRIELNINIFKFNKKETTISYKEELDSLIDLQYILSGSVLALGYSEIFDENFELVHKSNMSKMCDNLNEVEDTIAMYITKGHKKDDFNVLHKNDKYIVYRASDNKILKNKYYKKANIQC